MSVRKVLENFLEHVKKLEAAEEEGGKGNFSREFQVNILQVSEAAVSWFCGFKCMANNHYLFDHQSVKTKAYHVE